DVAVDALGLEGHHLLEVELRRRDADAHVAEALPRLLEKLGGMQQRLRGDAADVEAGAAVRLALLDDRGVQAELRRPDGADVAPGAGSDDDEIVGHEVLALDNHSAAERRARKRAASSSTIWVSMRMRVASGQKSISSPSWSRF